ncbi:MAG: hypothetical protein ACI8VT_002209 [Saprospiraceae bacterium]|jgi:hypothetical protein
MVYYFSFITFELLNKNARNNTSNPIIELNH